MNMYLYILRYLKQIVDNYFRIILDNLSALISWANERQSSFTYLITIIHKLRNVMTEMQRISQKLI